MSLPLTSPIALAMALEMGALHMLLAVSPFEAPEYGPKNR
jgi:hypothetical protein